jgi:hypothetical protein
VNSSIETGVSDDRTEHVGVFLQKYGFLVTRDFYTLTLAGGVPFEGDNSGVVGVCGGGGEGGGGEGRLGFDLNYVFVWIVFKVADFFVDLFPILLGGFYFAHEMADWGADGEVLEVWLGIVAADVVELALWKPADGFVLGQIAKLDGLSTFVIFADDVEVFIDFGKSSSDFLDVVTGIATTRRTFVMGGDPVVNTE